MSSIRLRDVAALFLSVEPALLFAALCASACGGMTNPVALTDAASAIPCAAMMCGGGEVCISTLAGDGPCIAPDDAGLCGDDAAAVGSCCQDTLTFACAPVPRACNGVLGCPCASSLCACGACNVGNARNLECDCTAP